MENNICCLYLTNNDNLKLENWPMYISVKNMCIDANIDLFTYVENKTMENTAIYHYDLKSCEFDYNCLFSKFKYHNKCHNIKPYVGNTFLTLLDLYTWYSYYDYYIFYEDDLGWFSDENLFKQIDYSYDLIIDKPKKDNNWPWQNVYTNIDSNYNNSYCGLLNLYVVSNKFLKELIDYVLNGNYGHFEYLIKAFAYDNNFAIGYLNDTIDLEFEHLSKNLSGEYHDLVHPVKNNEKIDYYLKLKK